MARMQLNGPEAEATENRRAKAKQKKEEAERRKRRLGLGLDPDKNSEDDEPPTPAPAPSSDAGPSNAPLPEPPPYGTDNDNDVLDEDGDANDASNASSASNAADVVDAADATDAADAADDGYGYGGGGGDDDDDDGDDGGGGGGGGGDAYDDSDELARGEPPPGAGASSLVVLCDPGFERPVAYEQLSEEEKGRAEFWFRNVRSRRAFRGLSNEAIGQLKAQIYERVRHFNLVTNLPSYKCCARPLSDSERKQLTDLRRQINNALREQTDEQSLAQRNALKESEASQYDDRTLAAMNDEELAEKLGPFLGGNVRINLVREELHSRLVAVSLAPDAAHEDEIKKLAKARSAHERSRILDEYHDFMNEERRLILRTIRNANEQKNEPQTPSWLVVPATKDELEAEIERSTEKEYERLFNAVREPEATVGAQFKALDESMWQHCANVPPTSFASPVDCAALLGGTDELRAEAKHWCLVVNRGDTFNGRTTLANIGGCRPGKRWPFPWDKANNKPLPGFWPALKRVREVKNELGGLSKTLQPWACQRAYDADPLIKAAQTGVVISPKAGRNPKRVIIVDGKERILTESRLNLMQQVVRKHVAEEEFQKHNRYGETVLAIELLRCYPKPMTGTKKLNSILDFVCWWHQTIATNEDLFRARAEAVNTSGNLRNEMTTQRKLAVYDLMCCPDCLTYQKELLENIGEVKDDDGRPLIPTWAKTLRSNVNDRVGNLISFMRDLKLALDIDVFQTPQQESVLWRGGYLYWDAQERYDRLSAPFKKAEELRERHRQLATQVEDARASAEEARDIADEAQDELDNEPDVGRSDEMYADVFDKAEQANRLEKVLEKLEERALAVDAEATEAERQVAQLPASAVQERADALGNLTDTVPPSEADKALGRTVYKRWQEMNPMKT